MWSHPSRSACSVSSVRFAAAVDAVYGAATDDLADRSCRQVAAIVADDPHLVERRRDADAAGLAQRIVTIEHRDKAFGQPVELVEASRQELVQPVLDFLVQRRAERQDHLE